MAFRPGKPSVAKRKIAPLVPTPKAGPDPKFYAGQPKWTGPKPPPHRGVLRFRGNPDEGRPAISIKGKTYRSDTGGTVTVGKSAPLKKSKGTSAMPDASQHDTSRLKYFGKGA